jgi:hypothetical protein
MYMSPGAAVANPSLVTRMLIFSCQVVGLLAVQVVKPLYVEPGLTSIFIEIGAQEREIAAVGA